MSPIAKLSSPIDLHFGSISVSCVGTLALATTGVFASPCVVKYNYNPGALQSISLRILRITKLESPHMMIRPLVYLSNRLNSSNRPRYSAAFTVQTSHVLIQLPQRSIREVSTRSRCTLHSSVPPELIRRN